jgi:hypothetical protein
LLHSGLAETNGSLQTGPSHYPDISDLVCDFPANCSYRATLTNLSPAVKSNLILAAVIRIIPCDEQPLFPLPDEIVFGE